MFEDLRAAFREALDNFNKELNRDQVPETVDRLLGGMRHELADEKAQVRGLESELEKALAGSLREKEAAVICRRREGMARQIGDEETATLATQHAAKHEGYGAALEKKALAIREELDFRRRSVEEMGAQLAEATRKRGSLGATAGRAGARDALSEADDLFSELDRMAAKMTGETGAGGDAEALDSFDMEVEIEEELDFEVTEDAPPPRAELNVDAALAELKRRMGRE